MKVTVNLGKEKPNTKPIKDFRCPYQNLEKAIYILNSIFEECGDKRINEVLDLLVEPYYTLRPKLKDFKNLNEILYKK